MTTEPIILGFDTAAGQCVAAVLRGSEVLADRREEMRKGQAERLMGIIAETLEDADVQYTDLSAIGVGIGPGNFTGIRISVSAARGLALGLNITTVGVSGFDALRYGVSGPCACTIEARQDQVFFQAFDQKSSLGNPQLVPNNSIPAHNGPLIGSGGIPPVYPTAVGIALATGRRFKTERTKPSPLYIRPADAAPPRDAAPAILS